MTDNKRHPVAEPSLQWRAQKPIWDLVDTLNGGTPAMRQAGTTHLPQEPAEPEPAYQNRLSRSVLTPFYSDIIKKLMGKILKQPVVMEEDVPPAILRYMDDVDAAGTDINGWTLQIGSAALNHGVTFILVDAPAIQTSEDGEEEQTRADVIKGTFRPYAIHVKSNQILGWKSNVVDGQVVLTQVRIEMVTMEDNPQDEFTQIEVTRIHVWEIGRRRIYRKVVDPDGKVEWLLEDDTSVDLEFIPLIAVYGKRQEFMVGEPSMLDVAYLNITHWQSDSDQRHILHVARVPILFGSGLGTEERADFQLQIGANTMTRGPQGSDLKFVEHSGAGIKAGAEDLETLEERMSKLGLNMVVKRKPGNETATARTLDQSESDSPLGMFSRHLEKSLEKMMDIFGVILNLGDDSGGSLTLFKDFSITQRDGDDIKALADMRTRGDISQRTYWEELKRRNLLNDDFDAEAEIDLLDLEYQDGMMGLTEEEDEGANKVGDETGIEDGHTHVLQANGFTNIVNDHRHEWEPTGNSTSEADGHSHTLRGQPDGQPNSRQGNQDESTPPAGGGQESDT